jgi:hypothetical protein
MLAMTMICLGRSFCRSDEKQHVRTMTRATQSKEHVNITLESLACDLQIGMVIYGMVSQVQYITNKGV